MPTIRPSSLPALEHCKKFESSGLAELSTFAEDGTDRHSALSDALMDDRGLLNILPDEDQAGVEWAFEYIRLKAPMGDHLLILEQRRSLTRNGETVLSGTPDVVCGDHIFDLKWRDGNYDLQMLAYALMVMDDRHTSTVTIHCLYGERQRAVSYLVEKGAAELEVFTLIDLIKDEKAVESPNEYCGWCSRRLTCPALVQAVEEIGTLSKIDIPSTMDLTNPEVASKALTLSKAVVEWATAVQVKVKEIAVAGTIIPGYRLIDRKGARTIPDIPAAFLSLGIPQKNFLAACKVSLTELEKQIAKVDGITGAEAKRKLNDDLSGLIATKPSTQFLKGTV